MSSKLSVKVNDPNAPVIPDAPDEPADVEPIVIPDTGGNTILDTKNISDNGVSIVLPIVGAAVLAVIIVVTIITVAVRRRKVNKFSVHTSRHLVAKVASLSIVLLLGLFAIANLNSDSGSVSALLFGGGSSTKASIHDSVNALSITTNDITINLDLEDDKVFGVGESVVSVDTATTAGYTLMAYVDSASTNLKNETDTSSTSIISMLETSYSQALTDNTWGMAISKPNSEEDVLFRGLPTTEKEILTLKATSEATPAGDESTFYYGAYITPDLDYGTYGGVTINYVALANVDTDVVTVRYLSDEGDLISVASYGANNRIAYLYDGCPVGYLGETQIIKTDNLDDDGVMTTTYTSAGSYEDFQYAKFDGADYLRVKITFGIKNRVSFAIFDSSSPDEDGIFKDFDSDFLWGDFGKTTTLNYIVESDTVGFGTTSSRSGNYGYYAMITPVYLERPSSVETTEFKNCHIAKSDNIDEYGNKINDFEFLISNTPEINDPIYIPGADRMIVDAKYGFASYGASLEIFKGISTENHGDYSFEHFNPFSSEGSFHISGDSVTIYVGLQIGIEDFDEVYGYYMRAYPIFYKEHENSTPILIYDAFRKSGSYDSSDYLDTWGHYLDGTFSSANMLLGEEGVIDYIGNNFETLRGKTIDLVRIVYSL